MSNRDGKGAKKNSSRSFSEPKRVCPKCLSSPLEKCGQYGKGHEHHRFCPKCKYSNF